jgi:hypothetical protein
MMRLAATLVIVVPLLAVLSACDLFYRVEPEDAAERAVAGAALGTALGTGLGTTLSINPAIGSIIGAESGAALGAAAGIATAARIPEYQPIPVPTAQAIPGFYDGWPPGYHAPLGNPETKGPPSG